MVSRALVAPPGCLGIYANGPTEYLSPPWMTGACASRAGELIARLAFYDDMHFVLQDPISGQRMQVGRFLRDPITKQSATADRRRISQRRRPPIAAAARSPVDSLTASEPEHLSLDPPSAASHPRLSKMGLRPDVCSDLSVPSRKPPSRTIRRRCRSPNSSILGGAAGRRLGPRAAHLSAAASRYALGVGAQDVAVPGDVASGLLAVTAQARRSRCSTSRGRLPGPPGPLLGSGGHRGGHPVAGVGHSPVFAVPDATRRRGGCPVGGACHDQSRLRALRHVVRSPGQGAGLGPEVTRVAVSVPRRVCAAVPAVHRGSHRCGWSSGVLSCRVSSSTAPTCSRGHDRSAGRAAGPGAPPSHHHSRHAVGHRRPRDRGGAGFGCCRSATTPIGRSPLRCCRCCSRLW